MKKSLIFLIIVTFAIGLLSVACDEDDILPGSGGSCTESEANECADEAIDCINAVDVMSDTATEDMDDCEQGWCDCLDSEGCDEYLDEAGCE